MLGILLRDREVQEIAYLIKKELDEILFDLEDERIDGLVRRSMEDRYQMIFRLYSRLAKPGELSKYVRHKHRLS